MLDIGLPKLDGDEAATAIIALGLSPRPIIAAVSGFTDVEHATRCKDADIAHLFIKPIDNSELKSFIASIALKC